jgi:nicotinate-nucleotide adenylyltransferase
MNIGILGGTFNPPTIGHIRIAQELILRRIVNEIWLMPVYEHNQKKISVPYETRVTMCELALSGLPPTEGESIKVSMFESLHREESSTFQLSRRLAESFPHHKFYFIIGMDQANNIGSWHESKALRDSASFIILPRKGVDPEVNWIDKDPHRYFEYFSFPHTSSSKVREDMKNPTIRQEDEYEDLNIRVFKYIKIKKLYL